MTIFQTLRTTFDVCKSLPKVSPSLRFFSVSQVAYEPPQDDLNAKISKRREYLRQYHEACRFKSNVDPEYRRQRRELLSAIDRRYYQNPDHHEIIKLKRRILYARRVAENPSLYARSRLHLWLNRHAWVRDERLESSQACLVPCQSDQDLRKLQYREIWRVLSVVGTYARMQMARIRHLL